MSRDGRRRLFFALVPPASVRRQVEGLQTRLGCEGRVVKPDNLHVNQRLGRIYLEAGLQKSALTELERAATLAPKDDTIKDWLRRAKRDGT